MTELDDWHRVERALSDGSLVGVPAIEIVRHETHMSVVVEAGDLVFKLKKPVVFDFADYGSRERRRVLSIAEIPLNRRLAPQIYLGVSAVITHGGELVLRDGDNPDALEHVVVMQRIDLDEMLDRRVDRRSVRAEEIEAVGRVIGHFHLNAAAAPEGAWSLDWIREDLRQRCALLCRWLPNPLDLNVIAAVQTYLERWLDLNNERLRQRAAAGWVRDGHGDLRLEHVLAREPIQVIDCVEFDSTRRQTDVLSDLAFLVMELELAERDDLATVLYRAWGDVGGPLDEELLWIYAALRALIRAEVALRRAQQLPEGFEQQLNTDHARSLLRIAEVVTWKARRPLAVLFGGLSGSGKTTIASHLAHRWGLERLSSDEIRKSLVGIGKSARAPEEAYIDGVSLGVYESLGARAGGALENGRSIVVDATFRRRRDYEAFSLGLARATTVKSQIVALALVAEADELRDRLENRARASGSDATLEVLEQQIGDHPSLRPELREAIEISTEAQFADVVKDVNAHVLEQTLPG